MIINSLADIKQFLPSVNLKTVKSLEDSISVSQKYITDHIIGSEIEILLEAEAKKYEKNTLHTMVSRAISLDAYLKIIPEIDLQLSEAGFVVQQNEHMVPASRQRVDALIANIAKRSDYAFDDVTNYLLANSDTGKTFAIWRESPQYDYLIQTMIPTFSIYKDHITDVHNELQPKGWNKFYDLIPLMYSYFFMIEKALSKEYINRLREFMPNAVTLYHKIVLRYIRIALTSFAVGNEPEADSNIAKARKYMIENINHFPEFKNSDSFIIDSHNAGNKPIANFI